ncbi:MAG: outer membrane lipoprotein LolB [Pseudomonadales bacterium]|nr:outer membrane lipoprotein LolB [Pseudomonadales bacterium]
MQIIRFCLALLTAAGLASCAQDRPKSPQADQPWQSAMGWLNRCSPWSMQGKMGLHWGHHGGSMYFVWQENQATYDIDLNGPLGEGSMHVHGDAQGMDLQDDRGTVQHAETPESMLKTAFGIDAPISRLRDWIHGRAGSPDARVILDDLGRIASLHDGKFQVNYTDYATVETYSLPSHIHITGPQFSLVMAIHQWSVPEKCHKLAY